MSKEMVHPLNVTLCQKQIFTSKNEYYLFIPILPISQISSLVFSFTIMCKGKIKSIKRSCLVLINWLTHSRNQGRPKCWKCGHLATETETFVENVFSSKTEQMATGQTRGVLKSVSAQYHRDTFSAMSIHEEIGWNKKAAHGEGFSMTRVFSGTKTWGLEILPCETWACGQVRPALSVLSGSVISI